MADQPGKHGHQHVADGPDPIPGLGSAAAISLPTAFANGGASGENDGNWAVDFSDISWNDDTVFGYDVTSGSPLVARYVTVTPGIYDVRAVASWNSTLSVNNSIQITCWLPSMTSVDLLANTIGVDAYQEEQSGIWNEQLDAGERAHTSLRDNIVFSWTEAGWGETNIGLGIRITIASAPITKLWSGLLMVTRLGDAATEQTIT